jgi:import inner membrane translocase subunit TIM8
MPPSPQQPGGAVSPQLQQFIEQQQQMVHVQQLIATLTDVCWDKCISTPGASLSGKETNCVSQCAQRFIDATQYILQRAQHKAGSDGGF